MTEHRLVRDRYGKERVHLTWIERESDPHVVRQLALDVSLEGDFAASYVSGDNRAVIATDSMKNTVYVLARERGVASLEGFARALAAHFVETYPQVERATVSAEEHPWRRIRVDGAEHPHAFLGGCGLDTAQVRVARAGDATVRSGLRGLQVMKTAGSGFSGFVTDRFRTLADTDDRLFATTVEATWRRTESSPGDDEAWPADRAAIREALLGAFARHHSLSVQQTLYRMGEAALDAAPEVSEISLVLPNQHHLLVDLAPFGLDNPNRVFVGTREPFGCIEGTVRRGAAADD